MNLRSRAIEQGLTSEEFDRIIDLLGREPNEVELGIIAVMWSEHCSYKTTKKYLKTLPTEGPQVFLGPGENAGVIKLGEKKAVAFKVESHNHPSFIEPFQGAATGVGGILRDIFTMGARPVALLDSLHFGEKDHPKTPFLFHGVVSGISHYGNCMGIPTVGGETHFAPCYNGNILVNAMAVGVCNQSQIYTACASGLGNPVLYLGSKTGKDGIHGATMASEEFNDQNEEKRPTVQVGDPFTEKILMEATLEMLHKELVEGIQDMGAAGLACSTFEMASKGQVGMKIDLDKVPLREENTSAYEMFLSESQERMLLVTTPDRVNAVQKVAQHWGVDCVEIGHVTDTKKIQAFYKGEQVIELPVDVVVDGATELDRPYVEKSHKTKTINASSLEITVQDALDQYLATTESASKSAIYSQYDHTVGSDTLLKPGGDAAIIRVKDCEKNIAVTLDSRHRLCKNDAYLGTCVVFAESYRNLSAVGAKALGVTNCLNFGNPENPEVMWDIKQTIAAMKDCATFFQTPITGGNVSLYNQTGAQNIDPTPTLGMVGEVSHQKVIEPFFTKENAMISLLGNPWTDEMHQCDFLDTLVKQAQTSCCPVDFEQEKALQDCMIDLYQKDLIFFGRDISNGGLFQTLIESCNHPESFGAKIEIPKPYHPLAFLLGEPNANMLIVHEPSQSKEVEKIAAQYKMSRIELGKVESSELIIDQIWTKEVDQIRQITNTSLREI